MVRRYWRLCEKIAERKRGKLYKVLLFLHSASGKSYVAIQTISNLVFELFEY